MADHSFNPYETPAVAPFSRDDLRYKDRDCLIVYDEAKLPPFCPFSGKAAPKRWRPSKLYLRKISGRRVRWFDEAWRLALIVLLAVNPWKKYVPSAWILLGVMCLLLTLNTARVLSGAHVRCYLSPAIRCRRILAITGRGLLPFAIFLLFPGELSSRLASYTAAISWIVCSIMSVLVVFALTEPQLVTIASKGNWFRLSGCDREFLAKLPQVTNPPL